MSKKNLLSDITQSMKRDTLARAKTTAQEHPPTEPQDMPANSFESTSIRNVEHSNVRTFENNNISKVELSNNRPGRRGNKDGWARAIVTIEPKKYKRIKRYCLENDTTFQGFIESLISEHFEKISKSTKNQKGL